MEKTEVKTATEVYATGVSSTQDKAVDVFGDEEEHEIKYKTLSWQVDIPRLLR